MAKDKDEKRQITLYLEPDFHAQAKVASEYDQLHSLSAFFRTQALKRIREIEAEKYSIVNNTISG